MWARINPKKDGKAVRDFNAQTKPREPERRGRRRKGGGPPAGGGGCKVRGMVR